MPRGKKKDVEQPELPELVQTVEPKPIRKTKTRVESEPEVPTTEAVPEVKVPEKKARKVVVKKPNPYELKPPTSVVNEDISKKTVIVKKIKRKKNLELLIRKLKRFLEKQLQKNQNQ